MNFKIKLFSVLIFLFNCKFKSFIFKIIKSSFYYLIINKVNATIDCDEYDKMLCDHLINGYNKLVRPVYKNQDSLPVYVDLKLSRLIDIVNTHLEKILYTSIL